MNGVRSKARNKLIASLVERRAVLRDQTSRRPSKKTGKKMKDLLNFIVTSLVTKPEAVVIDEQREDGTVNLNLTVDQSDMGLIIGKSGQTIRAIRKLLTVRAIAENIRIN